MDLAHKIWLELSEYQKTPNIPKSNTLLNALCLDSGHIESATGLNSRSEIVQKSFLKCIKLFDEHCNLALNHLDGLRNENTNDDAIESLKSILNLMKGSINI
jgi:hypothetical protein